MKMHMFHVSSNSNPDTLQSQIHKLQPNHSLGIYVRDANCGMLLIRSLADDADEVTVATFQPSLSCDEIYGNEDSVKGDIQVVNLCRFLIEIH